MKRLAGLAVVCLFAAAMTACGGRAPLAREAPCAAAGPCGANAAGVCLAGTCTTRADLPGRTSTRVTMPPTRLAWIEEGNAPAQMTSLATASGGPSVPPAFGRLGGGEGAKLLLRFAWPPAGLAGSIDRIEAAYVVLTLIDEAGVDGNGGLSLAAERIVEPWDPAAVTWASQPRAFDVGARPSFVAPRGGPRTVRVDVGAILARAGRHDGSDYGIAIAGRGASVSSVALTTLAPSAAAAPPEHAVLAPPRLEVYLAP